MQKGLSLPLVLIFTFIIAFVISLIVIWGGGYYRYSQQKSNINSFEECAKFYPVMESYPAQCSAPDGRHFVQELSEEEKKKLVPPQEIQQNTDETAYWKTYTNTVIGLSLKYPADWLVKEQYEGKQISIYSSGTNPDLPEVSIMITENFPHNENPDYKSMTDPKVIYIDDYKATLREDKDDPLPRAGGFGYIQFVEIEYGENLIYLTAEKGNAIFSQILETIELE